MKSPGTTEAIPPLLDCSPLSRDCVHRLEQAIQLLSEEDIATLLQQYMDVRDIARLWYTRKVHMTLCSLLRRVWRTSLSLGQKHCWLLSPPPRPHSPPLTSSPLSSSPLHLNHSPLNSSCQTCYSTSQLLYQLMSMFLTQKYNRVKFSFHRKIPSFLCTVQSQFSPYTGSLQSMYGRWWLIVIIGPPYRPRLCWLWGLCPRESDPLIMALLHR